MDSTNESLKGSTTESTDLNNAASKLIGSKKVGKKVTGLE